MYLYAQSTKTANIKQGCVAPLTALFLELTEKADWYITISILENVLYYTFNLFS